MRLDSWQEGLFLLTPTSTPDMGPTQTPIQRVSAALSPGAKQPGHEGDLSPPSSSKVKNAWSYTSTPTMSSWRGT